MSVAEICALPVKQLADKDCRLWLWTTNRYLPAAFDVMKAWGFEYRQTLVWHKLDSNLGGSVAPNSCEFLLVGVRGQPPCNKRLKSSCVGLAHGKRHSEKPKEWHYLIEQVCGEPRLEMFARRKRHGWHVWGNELANDVEMPNHQNHRDTHARKKYTTN
jgi:N6-adenosine-specific RNA methylase IME4